VKIDDYIKASDILTELQDTEQNIYSLEQIITTVAKNPIVELQGDLAAVNQDTCMAVGKYESIPVELIPEIFSMVQQYYTNQKQALEKKLEEL